MRIKCHLLSLRQPVRAFKVVIGAMENPVAFNPGARKPGVATGRVFDLLNASPRFRERVRRLAIVILEEEGLACMLCTLPSLPISSVFPRLRQLCKEKAYVTVYPPWLLLKNP